MAINSPRIAGKPATERRQTKSLQVEVRGAAPSESYIDSSADVPQSVNPAIPDRQGQLIFHSFTDTSGLNRSAQAYIAVDINGTLEWKVVSNFTLLNKWTGKPYDPMFD